MPNPRRLFPLLAVAAVLIALTADPNQAVAASCSGNSHSLSLSNGSVSPGSGSAGAKFAFRVTYTDNAGCAPNRIVVVVVGVGTFTLTHVKGGLQAGATFERKVALPAGRWAYRFEASSGGGPGGRDAKLVNVDPPWVSVLKSAPTPTPKPTPRPTPKPIVNPTPPPPRQTDHPSASGRPEASASPLPTGEDGVVSTIRDRDDGAPFVGPHGTSPTPAGWTAPLPVLKLLASSIGIIGGLALFGLLFGRLLDPRPSAAFASASLRRRRDPPAGTESDT